MKTRPHTGRVDVFSHAPGDMHQEISAAWPLIAHLAHGRGTGGSDLLLRGLHPPGNGFLQRFPGLLRGQFRLFLRGLDDLRGLILHFLQLARKPIVTTKSVFFSEKKAPWAAMAGVAMARAEIVMKRFFLTAFPPLSGP